MIASANTPSLNASVRPVSQRLPTAPESARITRDALDVIDCLAAGAVALTEMVAGGSPALECGLHDRPHAQPHFDFVASTKLVTELTTLAASAATTATCEAEGLDGSALTALWSVSTEDFTAPD